MILKNKNPNIAKGGKTVYGGTVGICMLDTQFPRIPGDIANARTWNVPVLYRVVPKSTPRQAVYGKGEGILEGFIDAAKELVKMGADGITTNCGFLCLFQEKMAEAVQVPVATSSLMQVPLVQKLLPKNKRVGIFNHTQTFTYRSTLRSSWYFFRYSNHGNRKWKRIYQSYTGG